MESPSTLSPTLGSPPVPDAVTADRAAPLARHNLPPQPTRLLGREDNIELVRALLRREGVRLLTLTGPGGVGKTRLALAAAEAALHAFSDGVWFVDLSPLADPALVVPAVARALGVREVPAQELNKTLAIYLRDRSVLVVLDNVEHVLAAAPAIDALLAASPRLTLLASSREPLRLRREQVVEVPPLAVPDPARKAWTVEELATMPGVALFVERARAADAAFALTAANAAAVAELSRRLDGLPLAIELAAARTRLLEPAALVARVEHSLALLRWDAPDLPPRQRTLRATLDWSHDLLSPAEQAVFRRLGVFAGGFTLDVAEAVAPRAEEEQPSGELGDRSVLDVIAALVDKHLVRVVDRAAGETRFGLLATVREYALAQLGGSGEEAATRERHLAHYLALAERADRAMRGPDEATWLDRLETEQADLRAALAWAIATGSAEVEWRLMAALWPLWSLRGSPREGMERVEAALSRPYAAEPALLARILDGAGTLADLSGDEARAAAQYERGLAAAREAGDGSLAAELLGSLARLTYVRGDAARAWELMAEMLALARTVGAPRMIARTFCQLVLFAVGPAGSPRERQRLRAELDEPVALLRETGDRRTLAMLLAGRARLLAEVDRRAAQAALRESLELARQQSDPVAIPIVVWLAAVLLAERLPAQRVAGLVGGLAALGARAEERGARNWIDLVAAPDDRAIVERAMAAARVTLGEAAFAAVEAAAQELSIEQVVDEALTALAEIEPAAESAGAAGLLSPREREVLALVAVGRSNKEIADALFVSPNTVKTHVASLLNKLGADSRHQLAAIAAERGLR